MNYNVIQRQHTKNIDNFFNQLHLFKHKFIQMRLSFFILGLMVTVVINYFTSVYLNDEIVLLKKIYIHPREITCF